MRTWFSSAFLYAHCLLLVGMQAHSQEDTLTLTPATQHEMKTTYAINGNSATTTTLIQKASQEKEDLMNDFMFEIIAKKLKSLPMVNGVEFDSDVESQTTSTSFANYWEVKRSYPAMVQLSLPSAVTLMVRVEETYRKCKSPAEKDAKMTAPPTGGPNGGEDGGTTLDCVLSSAVKITGPHAVYGNFASGLNVEKLLKENQTISLELVRDPSNKTAMKLVSKFTVESELFDRNLFKFLSAFNLKVPMAEGPLFTRNNILLGIARIMRVNNERVVQ